MQTVHGIAELRQQVLAWRQQGLRIGFAPTMGNLHAGHISLIHAAQAECDRVVSSVFVNPLQFGPNEDFDAYPRTLADDQDKLSDAGCDLLFAPPVDEMYPNGQAAVSTVSVPGLTKHHCGASRPGHFDGVTTVVCKLLNLVQPDVIYLGKKDFQQVRVVRQMVSDLEIPTAVVGVPTCRESDGLAMSSRNQYLSEGQRGIAPTLRQILLSAEAALKSGATADAVVAEGVAELEKAGFKPDYFNVCDADSLEFRRGEWSADQDWVILASAYLGKARLIDNIEISDIN